MNQLKFDLLYNHILNQLPISVETEKLIYLKPDYSGYTVPGFGDIFDDIDERYIGDEIEVIKRELVNSLFCIVHTVAKTIKTIKFKDIRQEFVKFTFEQDLINSSKRNDLGWDSKDFDLVKKYFDVNSLNSSEEN